tara:strand:+ start:228 stop:503 length:276 start_codon:yes stop_codon:yes gene_type:complete
LRKAIGADGNEDWILDFEKMKIILKIIFSHVKHLMINQRRELQNGMDYKSWEEIHYSLLSKEYPATLFDPALENANNFLDLEENCLKQHFD